MARLVPEGRLREVARAAVRVFIAKGYRRTLMADVAGEVGLSSGALYTYVESKDALFHLALRYAMTPDVLGELALPIPTPPPGETVALVGQWLAQQTAFPILTGALKRLRVRDVGTELRGVIDERYDFVENGRRLLALIERSALDLPALSDLYFRQSRRDQLTQLTRYVDRRVRSGHFKPVPDAATTARFMVESAAWFAWHRKGDPDAAMIDDAQARTTVRHMLMSALLP